MSEQEKSAYQVAVDWYEEDVIHHCLKSKQRCLDRSEKVPTDIESKEFAVWLTGQYRAAMTKGIHLGEQRATNQ